LTRKDLKENVWTEECEEAFEEMKKRLTTAPLLHPPDLTDHGLADHVLHRMKHLGKRLSFSYTKNRL